MVAGVFGSGDPIEEPQVPEADEALGYASGDGDEPAGPDEGHPAAEQAPPSTGEGATPSDQQQQQAQQLLAGKYNSPEELARGYQNLEQTLGYQRQEIGQLRQQLQQYQAYLQQMAPMMQQQAQPQPYAQQPHAPAQTPQQQIDPQEWLNALYEQGPAAVQELIQRELQRKDQEYSQILQQVVTPLHQTVQQLQAQQVQERQQREFEMTRAQRQAEIDQLSAKYEDFESLKGELAQLFQEQPHLALSPQPVETAYFIVKARRGEAVTQAGGGNAPSPTAAKAAARMPSSGGRQMQPAKSENDQLVEAALGPVSSTGIFG